MYVFYSIIFFLPIKAKAEGFMYFYYLSVDDDNTTLSSELLTVLLAYQVEVEHMCTGSFSTSFVLIIIGYND